MDERSPKVSVIIPCYNYGRYLAGCVNSVLSQSFQDFEIIIINDASTDNTAQVANSFTDPRIRVVHHEQNRGPVFTFNEGLSLARGEYLHMISADDTMLPQNLSYKVDVLNHYPTVGLVYSNAEVIDEYSSVLGILNRSAGSDQTYVGNRFREMLYGNLVVGSVDMWRRAALDKVGRFDPAMKFGEDWELKIRIARYFDFAYIDRVLARYRRHGSSLSKFFREDLDADLQSVRQVLEKVFATFPLAQEGYSFQQVYWANYARVLRQKLGVSSFWRSLRAYFDGLRREPGFILTTAHLSVLPDLLMSLFMSRDQYNAIKRHLANLIGYHGGRWGRLTGAGSGR